MYTYNMYIVQCTCMYTICRQLCSMHCAVCSNTCTFDMQQSAAFEYILNYLNCQKVRTINNVCSNSPKISEIICN